jgi:hypothetical protein
MTSSDWTRRAAKGDALAVAADTAKADGRVDDARQLYRQSAEIEQAVLADVTNSRLRSLVAVSAVARWYKAGEYVRGAALGRELMADETITAAGRDELERLFHWCESLAPAKNMIEPRLDGPECEACGVGVLEPVELDGPGGDVSTCSELICPTCAVVLTGTTAQVIRAWYARGAAAQAYSDRRKR